MKSLLNKEIRLTMHPTAIIFMALSAMLIIPNYPYYVTFFYTGLAVFFTCLNGRENRDVFYTMTLPVRKKDVVKARFIFVILLQMAQIIIAIPFALLRQSFTRILPNQVGMEANIAFFGLSFILLGIFNVSFFNSYYKDVNKVGKSFGVSSVIVFLYITVAEVCDHAIPVFRDKLDTFDNVYVSEKLIVLAIGIVVYCLLTYLSYRKSVRTFETLDL